MARSADGSGLPLLSAGLPDDGESGRRVGADTDEEARSGFRESHGLTFPVLDEEDVRFSASTPLEPVRFRKIGP